MKFITDRSLGTLTKWLRLLGYDTRDYTGDPDRIFLTAAQREERTVITRKRDLAGKQFRGRMLVLESDRVETQLAETIRTFELQPDPKAFFSRCLTCNVLLVPLPKEEARAKVPAYTFKTQEKFMTCPSCCSVFWPGTHVQRAEELLKQRIPTDRP